LNVVVAVGPVTVTDWPPPLRVIELNRPGWLTLTLTELMLSVTERSFRTLNEPAETLLPGAAALETVLLVTSAPGAGVAFGVGGSDPNRVEVGVGVLTGVRTGVRVGVRTGVLVGVRAGVLVGVRTGVLVGVRAGVLVGVRAGVRVAVRVGVRAGVLVGVRVAVLVGVRTGVRVGVRTGVRVAVGVVEGSGDAPSSIAIPAAPKLVLPIALLCRAIT
jgi:hypothetical protein